jgi:hypothetical protein
MGHDLGDVFLMMRTVRRFVNTQLWTSFSVRSRNDPVEPLLITVDPQDLCPFVQTPTVMYTAAERNLLKLVFWSQAWLNVFCVQRIRLMGM